MLAFVQVSSSVGTSAFSKIVTHSTDPLPPGPVRSLAPIWATAASVTLAWTAGVDHGLPISSYKLESAPITDSNRWELCYQGSKTCYTVTDLKADVVQLYRVCAINGVRLLTLHLAPCGMLYAPCSCVADPCARFQRGAGPWQAHLCQAGPVSGPPPPPMGAALTAVADSAATVAWQPSATLAQLNFYELQISPRTEFARATMEQYLWSTQEAATALPTALKSRSDRVHLDEELWVTAYQDRSCACSLTGLFPACIYQIRVRASSDAGTGAWSPAVQVCITSRLLCWSSTVDLDLLFVPDSQSYLLTQCSEVIYLRNAV
jgi:hypothetical protein